MTIYRPPQCTEREPDGSWEDCTWASGVMLWNAVNGKAVVPSTRKEYEALRVAGGDGPAEKPGDGSNLAQLQVGMEERYGWAPTRIGPPGAPHPSFATLMQHLDKPGDCAVVQGLMGAWPASHHWNRWDRQFRGPHAGYLQRESDLARVWWMNPLAPADYPGEWMSLTDLRRYWDAWIGGAALGRVGQLAPPDTSTEGEAMKLTDVKAVSGTAVITNPAGYALWIVATNERTKVLPQGTRFDVSATCRYRPNAEVPDGYPGYVVAYGKAGEMHVLPAGLEGQHASFYAQWTTTQAYNAAVEDAAKACAKGGAQAVLELKR